MKKNVLEYNVIFQEEIAGGYSAWVPDLPGCASQGESLEETLANIKEAIELYVEDADVDSDSSTEYRKQFLMPVRIYA